jgi:hypothetical protein
MAFDTAATFTDPSWMTWDAESLREKLQALWNDDGRLAQHFSA